MNDENCEHPTKPTVKEPSTSDKYLLQKRMVFLNGEINRESMGILIKELFYLDAKENKPITLYVNTEGGDPYEVLGLYDVVHKQIKSKVHIIVQGIALSAGAFMVGICATGKRYAGSNTTFMIHETSSGIMGKLSEMEIDVQETKRLDRKLNELLARHSKMKKKDLNKKFLKDYYFTSKKALEFGLIDKIL